jgi:hypothetical protein
MVVIILRVVVMRVVVMRVVVMRVVMRVVFSFDRVIGFVIA